MLEIENMGLLDQLETELEAFFLLCFFKDTYVAECGHVYTAGRLYASNEDLKLS